MTPPERLFGGMTWSIKESLLRYVSNFQGDVTLTDGVESNQGSFTWPLTTGMGQEKDESLILRFAGSVFLQAHHGVFQVVLSEISLHLESKKLLLSSAGISDRPFLSGNYRRQRIDQGLALISDAPRLLEAGVEAFGNHYSVGTHFDPLIVVFEEAEWLSSSPTRA